jgi:hypothetical protein
VLEAGEPIALVLSDIVMPSGMSEHDLAGWIRSRKPEPLIARDTSLCPDVSNTLSHGTLAGEITGTGEPGLKGITVFARLPH